MNNKYYFYCAIISLLFALSCTQTETSPYISEKLEEENLKGYVRQTIEDFYEYNIGEELTEEGIIRDLSHRRKSTVTDYDEDGYVISEINLKYHLTEYYIMERQSIRNIYDDLKRTIFYEYISDNGLRYYHSNRLYEYDDVIKEKNIISSNSSEISTTYYSSNDNTPTTNEEKTTGSFVYDTKTKILEDYNYPSNVEDILSHYVIREVLSFDEDGNISSHTFYDKNHNETHYAYYMDGERYVNFYEYNNQNQLVKNKDTRFKSNTTYTYKDGNVISEKEVNEEGIIMSEITSSWNDHNDLTSRIFKYESGKIETYYYSYEYDKKGNWIICKKTKSDDKIDLIWITVRRIEYWDGTNSDEELEKVISKYYKPQSKQVSSPKAKTQTEPNTDSEPKTKLTPCSVCKGDPHKICKNCWGNGYVTKLVNIGGSLYSEPADCPLCIAGYTTCTACGGSGYIQNAVTPPPTTINDFPSSASSFSTSSSYYDYQAEYNRWENQVKGIFHSLEVIGGFHTENNDGSTSYSINSSNGGSNQILLHNLISIQSEMRKTRQEAQRNGVNIYPSEWETKKPSFY